MQTINDKIKSDLLDQRNETGHLSIIDERDVDAAGCERTTLAHPVAVGIVFDSHGELLLMLLGKADIGRGDTLENIMAVLGRAEDRRRRLGDIPLVFDPNNSEELNQSVAHEFSICPKQSWCQCLLARTTPPPCGVLEKNPGFAFRFLKSSTWCITAFRLGSRHV